MFDVIDAMKRAGRKAQPLGALGHCGVVDGLHIDAPIIHQHVADHPAFDRILDHHRDDMAGVGQMRDADGTGFLGGICGMGFDLPIDPYA